MIADSLKQDDAYAALLRECKSLADGKNIHSQIQALQLRNQTFLANLLLQMYARFGDVQSARQVFDGIPHRNVFSWTLLLSAYSKNGRLREARMIFDVMPEPNVVSWNSMISAYHRCGDHLSALQLVSFMDLAGHIPSPVTILIALEACGSIPSIAQGRSIHQASACESALRTNVEVGAALVTMYGNAGSVFEARSVFKTLPLKNVVSWTAILGAYAHNGNFVDAVIVFREMLAEGVRPDSVSVISILDACSCLESLSAGDDVFRGVVSLGGFLNDVRVANAVVNMYGKCGGVGRAKIVFDCVVERNVVTWTTMVCAYAQNGEFAQALDLFRHMDLNGVIPEAITFVSAVDAAGNLRQLIVGKILHEELKSLFLEDDLAIATALVNMYAKCEETELAKETFDRRSLRLSSEAGIWNAIISGYAQNRQGKEVMQTFRTMDLEGIAANRITLITVLDACANLPALAHDKLIDSNIDVDEIFQNDLRVQNALVNMFGKCGSLIKARSVFDRVISRSCSGDIVTWTSMIEAYAQNGYAAEAIEVFQVMELEGVIPNLITFTSIISACTHTGLVGLGMFFFAAQVGDYGLVTSKDQPFVGVVDLLGRAGGISDAEVVTTDMPFHPHSAVLETLLGACRIHGDRKTANRIAAKILSANPKNRVSYQLLSNICRESGGAHF